VKKSFKREKY